jgi:putative ABC transport system ATP-binding protein
MAKSSDLLHDTDRMPFVELTAVERRFGAVAALDGVSLAVEAGEWVAFTGPSGSGKTTLLNLLAGLDRPTAGRVRVGARDVARLGPRDLARYRQRQVGLVFQQAHLMPYLTAVENVMLAQYVHSVADRGEAAAALARVGLGERLDHLPSQLSGGEQQRVCIARALINQPALVLADEPTGNLDAANEEIVVELLAELEQSGHTVVMVTHSAALAARADREVRLDHGRVVASTPAARSRALAGKTR